VTEAGPKLLRGLLEVFLLESLEQQPKHGYALLKEMGETFGAQPNRNRLYPLLAKLVADGYIREVGEPGGNRTLYTLTDAGRDALHAYRRLPPAFRHALKRIWSEETHPGSTGPGHGQGATTTSAVARTIPVISDEEPRAVPALESDLPYPCEDARVALDKDARTGALSLRVTGCPMGAFDYCPECPIYKGVAALVLTSSAKD
jgi:DNA-binding PadR family transcriptional regulator